MAAKSIIALILVGLVARVIEAQFNFNRNGGWNLDGFTGLWGGNNNNNNNNQNVRYATCIGHNDQGDEMRLTFSEEDDNNNRLWWQPRRNWWNRRNLKLSASIKVAGGSTTNGQYSLVMTEYGRVADGCYGAALGRIVDDFQNINTWFQPRRQEGNEIGRLGSAFYLAPNNGQQWNGDVNGFDGLEDIHGYGVGLCGSIVGGMCQRYIPVCCTISRDSAPATRPIHSNMNQFGAVNGGMNNGGMNNGMPGGMNNGGMNSGLPGGMNNGGMNNLPGSNPINKPSSNGLGGLQFGGTV